MKRIPRRLLAEIAVVSLVMVVGVNSYVGRNESVVGKREEEILMMAKEKNDYKTAQRVYENSPIRSDVAGLPTASDLGNVLGATTGNESIEVNIYPEKKIAGEINRLEELLEQYPTYPPLLSQLAKLRREIGDTKAAEEYEREIERLNVNTH